MGERIWTRARRLLRFLSLPLLAGSEGTSCGYTSFLTLGVASPAFDLSTGEGHCYEARVSKAVSASAVTAWVESGDIEDLEMFVTRDGRQPTPEDSDFSTAASGGWRNVLPLGGWDQPTSGAKLSLLVTARKDVQYRLLIASPAVPAELLAGAPQPFFLAAGSAADFKYAQAMGDSDGGAVAFSATPSSGGSVRLSVTGPDGQIRSTDNRTIQAVTWDLADIDHAADASFTLTVSAADDVDSGGGDVVLLVSAALQGMKGSPIRILGGLPLDWTTRAGAASYFVFESPAGAKEVTLYLTEHSGEPDIVVETGGFDSGGEAESLWRGAAFGGDEVLTLTPADEGFLKDGGKYYVTVKSVCPDADTEAGASSCDGPDAEYTLQAYAAGTLLTLHEGTPLADLVPADSYHYYYFKESQGTGDLVFLVTPLSGDADVFVGCKYDPTGTNDGYPSAMAGHFVFSSRSFSTDVVVVPRDSPDSCARSGGGADGSGGGPFYVAIFAWGAAARFTVLVTHGGGVKMLRPGIPQRGAAYPALADVYQLRVGNSPAMLTVALVPLQGDANLYVSLSGERASSTVWDYSSHHSGSVTDQVSIPGNELCANCWVSIAAETTLGPASFTLTAAFEDDASLLSLGHPSVGQVGSGGYLYFQAAAEPGANVTVTLTLLLGRAAMLLSPTEPRPTLNASEGSDTAIIVPSGTSVPQATVAANGDGALFIGVYGIIRVEGKARDGDAIGGGTVVFTVLAHTISSDTTPEYSAPPNFLVLGLPQDGIVGAGEYDYYQVSLPEGHGRLDFTAMPLRCDVGVFVTRCPESDEAEDCSDERWRPTATENDASFEAGAGGGDRTATVEWAAEEPATYIVGVLGLQYQGGVTCSEHHYSLVVKEAKTLRTLVPGRPVRDYVAEGEWTYFQVMVDKANSTLTVSLTPDPGQDADLYMSTSVDWFNSGNEGTENATWVGTKGGADLLEVLPSDENYCWGCVYFIGVRGYEEAYFGLVASIRGAGSASTILRPGVPLTETVSANGYNDYELYYDGGAADAVKIYLQPLFGDADLYVNVRDGGSRPSETDYDYVSSTWRAAQEVVVIRPDDEAFQEACALEPCRIRMAVYGYVASEYTLTVSVAEAAVALLNGEPFVSAVAKAKYEYFDVVMREGSSVSFTITPQSGDVALYVSCGSDGAFPNATQHAWEMRPDAKVDGHGGLTLTVDANATGACPMPTTYHAAVLGETLATFSITGLVAGGSTGGDGGGVSMTYLVPGVSQAASVPYHEFRFFRVRRGPLSPDASAAEATIRVSAVAAGGSAIDLFVVPTIDERPIWVDGSDGGNSGHVRAECSGEGEETTGSQDCLLVSYATPESAAPRVISVDRDNRVICPEGPSVPCSFIAAVMGESARNGSALNDFAILADFASSTALLLADGNAVEVRSSGGEFRYFQVSVIEEKADLSISVSPFWGECGFFVRPANSSRASGAWKPEVDAVWASIGVGSDTLLIQAEEMDLFCRPDVDNGEPCDYDIAVVSSTNTSYIIVASLDRGWQRPRTLGLGVAQSGRVETGMYNYFQVHVPLQREDLDAAPQVLVTLTPLDGADLDLYLTADASREPGEGDFDLVSAGVSGSEVILFANGAPGYCSDCQIFLAVYGYEPGAYSIVAASGLTRLADGVPQQGIVDTDGSAYYSVHNPRGSNAVIDVRLSLMSGDADLFMLAYQVEPDDGQGWDGDLPGPGTATWESVRVGDDALWVEPIDEDYCDGCDYLIAVLGATKATYTVVASVQEDAIITLVSGRPQAGNVDPKEMKLYRVALSSSAKSLRLQLTAMGGTADIYASTAPAASEIDPGNPSTYTSTSRDSVGDSILLEELGAAVEAAVVAGVRPAILVAVVAGDFACHYALVATLSGDTVQLQPGVPQRHQVNEGLSETFAFQVDSPDEDVQISVVTVSGDVDIFGHMGGAPSCFKDGHGYRCQDWTWASTMYSEDTLYISHQQPCLSTHGMIVRDTCDPKKSFGTGSLGISVYGYEDSIFTITGQAVGRHTSLVGGMPQHGSTAPGVICELRGEGGACRPGAKSRQAQVAYYSFQVSLGDAGEGAHVAFDVKPQCSTDVAGPLNCTVSLLANSCHEGDCPREVMFPNPWNNDAGTAIGGGGGALFIAHDATDPNNGYCQPKEDAACYYFLAVLSEEPLPFIIAASAPRGVGIVPCRGSGSGPADGLTSLPREIVRESSGGAGQKQYEICALQGEPFALSLEACSGDLSLYVCDGTCRDLFPTTSEFAYSSDGRDVCRKETTRSAKDCHPMDPSATEGTPRRPPAITVDSARSETYFAAVVGEGSYLLRREWLEPDGSPKAAQVYPGLFGKVAARQAGSGSVMVSWGEGTLQMGADMRSCGPQCVYIVYAIPSVTWKDHVQSPCAAELVASEDTGPAGGRSQAARVAGMTSTVFTGLPPDAAATYTFLVVASCDWQCMAALFPAKCLPQTGSRGSVCGTRTAMYAPAALPGGGDGGGGRGDSSSGGMAATTKWLLVAVGALAAALALAVRRRRRLRAQAEGLEQYELINVGAGTGSGGSHGSRRGDRDGGSGRSGGGDRHGTYQPPMAGQGQRPPGGRWMSGSGSGSDDSRQGLLRGEGAGAGVP